MSATHDDTAELTVYGAAVSYYTGKLEGYLRYKEIPYHFVSNSYTVGRRLVRETGTDQIPAVELPDGQFMTDATPMIDWFEAHHPEPAVIPHDPLQAFCGCPVEDHAEEWLWRTPNLDSRHDPDGQVPFRGRKVHYDSTRS